MIIILSIIIIFLISFLIGALTGNFKFKFSRGYSTELVHDEKYALTFNTLKVNTDASDIKIIKYDGTQSRVVIYGDKERTSVSNDNKTLYIETKAKKCFGICFNFKSAKVLIYLPSTFDGEIDVSNSYGDVNIEEYENANITVTANCGDIKIAAGDSVDVKNDYGDIDVDYANTLKINESCGDVAVGETKDAKITNNYGDIEILSINGHADIENNCGDIKIHSLNIDKNSTIRDDLGDIKIGSTNEIYIEAKTHLGDTKINNNYRGGVAELKINNNCGDITVEN